MRIVADLHLHTGFSRATSPQMDLPHLARWAGVKGIDLLGTGDFTHPQWFDTLRETLHPDGAGIYQYEGVRFLVSGELSAVWSQGGRGRRVHLLILVPSLDAAERINRRLARRGNLAADGRPMLGISAIALSELIWEESPEAAVIPAHAWTPWYSVFGAKSGFDSLDECFGDHADRIFAIETGLSSDPPMNRRVSALDRLTLVSNSDAHSPGRLGREATIFDLPEVSYPGIVRALKAREGLVGTIEFHPEEGKYHVDGHRACGVSRSPKEAMAEGNRCPVCGKELTIGVLHRVEDLSDRDEEDPTAPRDRYWSLIPLEEILAQAMGVGVGSKKVSQAYDAMIERFGDELGILLDCPIEELERGTPGRVAEGIDKMRAGRVRIVPGYDGVYGKVEIPFDEPEQMGLF
jgi:uncharacterized protein (TIGR00375 family)